MKPLDLYLTIKYMNNPNYTEQTEIYSKSILDNGIKWIKDYIIAFHNIKILPNEYMYSYNSYANEKTKIYSKLIQTLKTVTKLYNLIQTVYTTKNNIIKPSIYATTPEFILDNYFYHPNRVFVVDYFKSIQLCDEFENMYYHILTALQELEFDLNINTPLYNI